MKEFLIALLAFLVICLITLAVIENVDGKFVAGAMSGYLFWKFTDTNIFERLLEEINLRD